MWSVLVSILVTYAYICFSVRSTSGSRPSFTPHRMLSYHTVLKVQVHRFGEMLDARLLSTPAPLDQ